MFYKDTCKGDNPRAEALHMIYTVNKQTKHHFKAKVLQSSIHIRTDC